MFLVTAVHRKLFYLGIAELVAFVASNSFDIYLLSCTKIWPKITLKADLIMKIQHISIAVHNTL